MAVTIRQIAEEAGVSRGTVDRVINGRGHVNPETEQAVRQVAARLGYQPNMAGKALAARKKNFVIGIILCSEGNEFFSDVVRGIRRGEKEAAEYGIRVLLKTMKGYEVERQLKLLDELGEQASLIVLNAINDERIAERIDALADRNVPVITVNTDVEGSRRLCHIGSDYRKSGETACGVMALLTGGKAKVGIATGSVRILGHNQRISGFHSVCRERFSQMEVVDIIETDDDDETGYREMKKMLRAHPQVDAVYVAAAGAAGVCRAVMEEKGEDTPVIVTSDSTPSVRELVLRGTVKATVCQQPFVQGYRSIQAAQRYLIRGELPQRQVYAVRNEIKIRENI